jgi:hypothetical protein
MSNKWTVTLEVDECIVREYLDQSQEDPGTTKSDVHDLISDVIADAGTATGIELPAHIRIAAVAPLKED